MSNTTKQALGGFLISIWALLTIMTCAAVWNVVTEVTLIVASVLLFGFNVVAIRKAIKLLSKLDKENKE